MNPVNPDKHSEERTGLAKQRVSDMLAMADLLGAEIGPDEVRKAALVHLGPASEWFATWTLNLAQANIRAATLVLAGQAPDDVIAGIMHEVNATKTTPVRRPRSTAAARARRAARRATEFLNGPAWRIVGDPNAPDPTEGP